jgi:hypothetical protein
MFETEVLGAAAIGAATVVLAQRLLRRARAHGASGEGASVDLQVALSATKFHRPECRYARDGELVDRSVAAERGLTACGVCDP